MSYFPLTKVLFFVTLAVGLCPWGQSLRWAHWIFDVGNIGKGDPVKILHPAGSIYTKRMGMI